MLRYCYCEDIKTPYTSFLSFLIYSSIGQNILNVLSTYTCVVCMHMSCPQIHVLSIYTCVVRIHMSFPQTYVLSVDILFVDKCLVLMHMSCAYTHVLSIYTCLFHIHMCCPYTRVFSVYTWFVRRHMSIVRHGLDCYHFCRTHFSFKRSFCRHRSAFCSCVWLYC